MATFGNNNISALAFIRVSSKGQEGNTSHDTQSKEIRLYCERHNLKIVREERIVESAKDSETRLQYAELEQWADTHNIRHRVYYMQDREARNLTDIERNEIRVKRDNVVLHYVKDNKVIDRLSTDSDFLMRDFQAVQNKHFSRILSTKVKDAMKTKAENGWYPSNHLPLGYCQQRSRDQFGRELKRGTIIVPDFDEKNVRQVRREFELRGKHQMTLEQITTQMVAEGFITLRQANRYESALFQRLQNRFYRGYFIWQGHEYEGKHPLIIDSRLFDQVQQTFGVRGLYAKKRGDFSGGWLKCGNDACGCHIVYDPKTKKNKSTNEAKVYKLYRCSNGKGVHEDFKGQYAHEDKIWEQLGGAVDLIGLTETFAKEITDAVNELQAKMITATKREMVSYREALEKLHAKEDGLYDDFKAGLLDESGYKNQVSRVRDQRRRFTQLLEHAQLKITDAGMETVKSTIELAKDAKRLWLQRSPDERRDFLNEILSNRFLDGPIVRYDLEKPFLTLVEMKENEKWRTRKDSNLRPPDS